MFLLLHLNIFLFGDGLIREVAEFHRQSSPALFFNDVNSGAVSLPLRLEGHGLVPLQTELVQSTAGFQLDIKRR